MTILRRIFLAIWVLILLAFWLNTPVMAASSQNTLIIFNNGLDNIRQQNYQQALIDFTQVIERQEELVDFAYSNRCLVNLQLHNNTAAQTDCIAAIQNNFDNLEANLNLGLAYYRQGKYEQAIAQYKQVIQSNKEDYRAYYNRGLSYQSLNNYQRAIASYQTALRYSLSSTAETRSLIYNDLALAYLMLSEDEPAISNFTQAISLNKNNYDAYYNRGCAYHRQGKYQPAIRDLTQAVQLKPDLTQAYVHRAILNHQVGAKGTAFNDLNLALKQYQNQGNKKQYNLILNLKQQLFYAQPSQIA